MNWSYLEELIKEQCAHFHRLGDGINLNSQNAPVMIFYFGKNEYHLSEKIIESYQELYYKKMKHALIRMDHDYEEEEIKKKLKQVRYDLGVSEGQDIKIIYVAEMDSEFLTENFIKKIHDALSRMDKQYKLLTDFFGIFDDEKTKDEKYSYQERFRAVHFGLVNGVWKHVFHLERKNVPNRDMEEIITSNLANAIVLESIFGDELKLGQELQAMDGHYNWYYLRFQRLYLLEQQVCGMLQRICNKLLNRLNEQDREKEKESFIMALMERINKEISLLCPFLFTENRIEEYYPLSVEKRTVRLLLGNVERYNIIEKANYELDYVIHQNTESFRNQWLSPESMRKIVLETIGQMHCIDANMSNDVYQMIQDRLKEMKNPSSSQQEELVEKEKLELQCKLLEGITKELLTECFQIYYDGLMRLSEDLTEFCTRVYGDMPNEVKLMDLENEFQPTLFANEKELFDELKKKGVWDDFRRRIFDFVEEAVRDQSEQSQLKKFADNSLEKAKNCDPGVEEGEITSDTSIQRIFCHGDKYLLRKNGFVEDPLFKLYEIMSLCCIPWNSEEALKAYYG